MAANGDTGTGSGDERREGLRVVVTGATGNIGTALVARLAADPAVGTVVGLARRPPEAGSGAPGPPGVRYEAVDVGDPGDEPALRAVLAGADAVVHLAWLFQPTHDPMTTWEANAVGSSRVAYAAAEAGVGAFVHSSSVGAYSPGPAAGDSGAEDTPVDESWPTHSTPNAAYGREKAYVERVLDAVEARHPAMRVVRLRPGFIFQWSAGTEQRRLFAGPFLPGSILKRGRLPVLPLPEGLRFQAVHTDDVAAAFHAAVVRDVRGAFNVAAGPVIDAAALGEVLGARPLTVPRPFVRAVVATGWHARLLPSDPALVDLFLPLPLLDTTRARTELGWEPTRTGTDALREALDGMAEGAGGATPALAPDSPSGRAHEVATGVGGEP
jgi:nucleoside-diphosphate-sugar epimerase